MASAGTGGKRGYNEHQEPGGKEGAPQRKRLRFAESPAAKGLAAERLLQDVTRRIRRSGKNQTGCLFKLLDYDRSFSYCKRYIDDLITGKLTIAAFFNVVMRFCTDLKLIPEYTTEAELRTMQEIIDLWKIIKKSDPIDFTQDPDKTDDESTDD